MQLKYKILHTRTFAIVSNDAQVIYSFGHDQSIGL